MRRESIASERLHCPFLFSHSVFDDVDGFAAEEVRAVVDLGEGADRCARTQPDGSFAGVDLTRQGTKQMCLSRAVWTNQPDPFAKVHFVGEREEQVVDGDLDHVDDAARRISASKADLDLLIWHRWRWRARRHELLPTGLGRVGLARVLEVHSCALFHDFHVAKQSSLFVVPTLERVTQSSLAFLSGLRERGVGAAVHPRPRTLKHHEFGGDSL